MEITKNITIAEFIRIQKQKLREHNAKQHPDDQLDWNDWKTEISNKDLEDAGIWFNARMYDANGDRGTFGYKTTNTNNYETN